MKTKIQQLIRNIRTDAMLQNSLYIIASTGVMAVFGFLFWLIGARLYSPQDIGLSSTLVTAITTLSMFAILGFDNALVRFLPTTKNRDRLLDTGLITTGLAAIVVSVGFLLLLPIISPGLAAVVATPWHAALFVIALLLMTLNTLTDSIFISFQRAKYILIADSGLSLAKILLPVALVGFGAFGLFSSFAASVAAAASISFFILFRHFDYRLKPLLHMATLRRVGKYSTGTYVAGLVGAIPAMALPIMATNTLGPDQAAYLNLAMTVAALLFIVPKATAGSLFAQGAKYEGSLTVHFMTALRHTAYILTPAILGAWALGHYLLLIFGAAYAQNGTSLLRILAASAVLLAFNTIATVMLKLAHRLWQLIAIEVAGTIGMLAVAIPLMQAYGLNGIGWAWIAGQAVMTLFLGIMVISILRNPNHAGSAPEAC